MEENMKNGGITVQTGRPSHGQGEDKGFSWESDDEGFPSPSGRVTNGGGGYSDGDADAEGDDDVDGDVDDDGDGDVDGDVDGTGDVNGYGDSPMDENGDRVIDRNGDGALVGNGDGAVDGNGDDAIANDGDVDRDGDGNGDVDGDGDGDDHGDIDGEGDDVDGDGHDGHVDGNGCWDEDGNCPLVSGSPVTIRVEPEIMSADGEEFIWDPEDDVSPPHQSTTISTTTTNSGNGMSYGCGCCGQQFANLRQLMEHMAQHAPQASGVSQATTSVQQHFTISQPIQPPILPVLPMMRPVLPQPAPSIVPPPNFGFACVLCGKVFARQGHLAMHCRLGHGVSPTKGWGVKVAPSAFIQQVRAKDVERPFECQLCQKRFVRKHHLQAHLRSHSGIKPFNCPLCGKALSSKQSVGIHMRQHEPIPQISPARPQ